MSILETPRSFMLGIPVNEEDIMDPQVVLARCGIPELKVLDSTSYDEKKDHCRVASVFLFAKIYS